MLSWEYVTRSVYDSMDASDKSDDKLFFIKYGDRIYNGENTFDEYIVIYNSSPGTSIINRVYINKNTLEGKIYDGDSWIDLINPVIQNLNADYDKNVISSIDYDKTELVLKVTYADDTVETINLSDLAFDISFENNIPAIAYAYCYLENGKRINIIDYIDRVSYNSSSYTITVSFSQNTSDLTFAFDPNKFSSMGCKYITVTGNKFIAQSVLYNNESNEEVIGSNKLHIIYRIDNDEELPTCIDLTNNVINSIINAVVKVSDTMTTVGFDHVDEILIADSVGNAKASGMKLSKEIVVPSEFSVPTEKAIYNFLDHDVIEVKDVTNSDKFRKLTPQTASEFRVPSEKAIVDQLSWGIID